MMWESWALCANPACGHYFVWDRPEAELARTHCRLCGGALRPGNLAAAVRAWERRDPRRWSARKPAAAGEGSA